MARPTAEEQIPDPMEAIREAAWQQIAARGAAALSLRAIARELGVTAPAIYNYYRRRDDLVTALIVDAFTSLGESQAQALEHLPLGDLLARFQALGRAYRAWALAHPQRYQLIFGTPIPGYQAPIEITTPAAAASLQPLIVTLGACREAGLLRAWTYPPFSGPLEAMLREWSAAAGGIDLEVLYAALAVWSRVHGLVSLEIGQQYPVQIAAPGEIYRRELDLMTAAYLG